MIQTLFQSYNAISNNLLVSELPDSLSLTPLSLSGFYLKKEKPKKP